MNFEDFKKMDLRIAEIKGRTLHDVCRTTSDNAYRVFRLAQE